MEVSAPHSTQACVSSILSARFQARIAFQRQPSTHPPRILNGASFQRAWTQDKGDAMINDRRSRRSSELELEARSSTPNQIFDQWDSYSDARTTWQQHRRRRQRCRRSALPVGGRRRAWTLTPVVACMSSPSGRRSSTRRSHMRTTTWPTRSWSRCGRTVSLAVTRHEQHQLDLDLHFAHIYGVHGVSSVAAANVREHDYGAWCARPQPSRSRFAPS